MMMDDPPYSFGDPELTHIEFECEYLRETDAAYHLAIGGTEDWIPKSVIHEDSEVENGIVYIARWWFEKEDKESAWDSYQDEYVDDTMKPWGE